MKYDYYGLSRGTEPKSPEVMEHAIIYNSHLSQLLNYKNLFFFIACLVYVIVVSDASLILALISLSYVFSKFLTLFFMSCKVTTCVTVVWF